MPNSRIFNLGRAARRAHELFNAGDLETAFALIHPEVEFRDLQHAPDLPESVRGRDAVRVVLAHWIDAYEFRVEVLDYVDAGAWVIADVRWCGRGRGSDVVVEVRQADACRVENGTIVAVTLQRTRQLARKPDSRAVPMSRRVPDLGVQSGTQA